MHNFSVFLMIYYYNYSSLSTFLFYFITSLQTAVSASSESSSFSKEQLTEKQQQIIALQKKLSEKEDITKEKVVSLGALEKEIGSLKIQMLSEVFGFQILLTA